MKKLIFLTVLVFLATAACSKNNYSNSSNNSLANSNNSLNSNNLKNVSNLNQNGLSETKTEVNTELLKQIESQQLETSDPRKASKQNPSNENKAPQKPSSSGKQTW